MINSFELNKKIFFAIMCLIDHAAGVTTEYWEIPLLR